MTDYSLSDVASVVRGNDGYGDFGNGSWWIIVLFLFAFMGGGLGNDFRCFCYILDVIFPLFIVFFAYSFL